jgi:hypothetical protein
MFIDIAPIDASKIEVFEANSTIQSKDGKAKAFVVGQEHYDEGAPKRWYISVNYSATYMGEGGAVLAKDNNVPLHQVPLMRMQYGHNGEVKVRANWVPGLPRMNPLTDAGYQREKARLIERYGDIFYAVYGGKDGQKCTLPDKLKEIGLAWSAMQKRLLSENRKMRDEDVEQILNDAFPVDRLDADIQPLDEIEADAAAGAVPNGKAIADLIDHLITKGIPQKVAVPFAQAAADVDFRVDMVADQTWNTILDKRYGPERRVAQIEELRRLTAEVVK